MDVWQEAWVSTALSSAIVQQVAPGQAVASHMDMQQFVDERHQAV